MLQLKNLHLENFGPVKQAKDIDFQNGFNLLLAPNGTGKSTAYKAIEILLLDEYQGKFEDYINWDSSKFKISLSFYFNSDPYFVSLTCEKGKVTSTTRELYKGLDAADNPIATGEEAKAYLSKLLDKDVVRYALIVKQSTDDHIVDCNDGDRRELIQKIIGINYDAYVENKIIPKMKIIDNEVTVLNNEIYSLENKDYHVDEDKPLPFSIDSKKLKVSELEKLNLLKHNYEEKIKAYREKVEQKESLEKEIQKIQERLTTKSTLKTGYESDISLLLNKPDEIEKEYQVKVEAENRALSILLEEFETRKKQSKETYQKELSEIDIELSSIEDKLQEIKILKLPKYDDTALQALKSDKVRIATELKRAHEDKELLASGVCPTCGSDCKHTVATLDDLVNSLVAKTWIIENKLIEEQQKKTDYEKELENNQKNKDTKESLLSHQKLLLEKKQSKESLQLTKETEGEKWLLVKNQAHEQNLITLLNTKNQALEQIEKDRGYKESALLSTSEDIKSLEVQKDNSEQKLASVFSWLSNNSESTENQDYVNKIETLTKEIESYDFIDAQNKKLEELRGKMKLQEAQDKETLALKQKEKENKLKNERTNLETAKNILLKDFPAYVIDQSVSSIEESMNQFIDDVYYKSLGISLRTTKSSLKLEYGVGKDKKPGHLLSGAERKITDIAFKSHYNSLAEISCLLLDEPDAALDLKNKIKLYESLAEMKERYGQMVVVTHSKEMVEFMKNNVDCNVIQM